MFLLILQEEPLTDWLTDDDDNERQTVASSIAASTIFYSPIVCVVRQTEQNLMQHYSGRVVGVAPVPAAAALQSVRAPVVGGIPWRSHITRIVVVVCSVYLAPHQIHWFGSSVAVVVPRSAPP